MTIAQQIGRAQASLELQHQTNDFVTCCRLLLANKGVIRDAVRQAESERVSPRVREVFAKAQTDPASFGTWAQFADYRLLISGFANALQSVGIFDRLLADGMRRIPLASATVGAVTTAATAYTIGEGSTKQVSRLSLSATTTTPKKAHALVAVSNELLRAGGPEVQQLLTTELINAAVLAIDARFLATALSGVSVGTSVGSTALAFRNDLASLLRAVSTDASSRLFLVTTPLVCKTLCSMGATSTNGTPAFPDLGPTGGSVAQIPVICSDALPTVGQVVLIDSTGFAGASDTIRLDVLRQGSVIPDTTPNSPPSAASNVVSLWQSNLSALLVERFFNVEKLRTTAVAAVVNSNSYMSGFSPP